ncbi:adenosine receptor A1 [Trichomycterus rosablanca]|uniref:adenosine receptor A1 n=1 Tax=Trichomycterus rosablanca TaxID=2290929 RepID=UPI002F35B6FC
MASIDRWVYILFEVLIAVACCIGNVLVICAVWLCGTLNQPTFCFIASLAMADLLVGTVGVPLSVLVDVKVETSFHACLFFCCVLIIPQVASVAFLLAIAVDRCLRVCIPLTYKSTVTKRMSWIAVASCWFTAAMLGFIPLFGWHKSWDNSTHVNSSTFECSFLAVISESYLVKCIFFSSLLPALAVILALYWYIFLTTRRQLRANVGVASESRTYYHKEYHLAGSLLLVLILFAVCWLPLYLMHTINFYGGNVVPPFITDICVLLSHANSAVNPILYSFKIPKIKVAYRKLWYRLCPGREMQHSKENNMELSKTTVNTTEQNQQRQ